MDFAMLSLAPGKSHKNKHSRSTRCQINSTWLNLIVSSISALENAEIFVYIIDHNIFDAVRQPKGS